MMTMDMCENMAMSMDQARITSDDYYLFSATDFEPALQSLSLIHIYTLLLASAKRIHRAVFKAVEIDEL